MATRKKSTPMPEPPELEPAHPLRGERLADDLETLQVLKDEATDLGKAAKAAGARYGEFMRYVLQRMSFERVPKQATGERTYYINRKAYAKVQDKAAFIAWALENDPELLKSYEVREGDLNERVRRNLDDGADLPDGVGYDYKDDIGSRAR